jgi:hypothetical protein
VAQWFSTTHRRWSSLSGFRRFSFFRAPSAPQDAEDRSRLRPGTSRRRY